MDRRLEERKSQFKKSFEDPRRKREDLQHQIRKSNRELNLENKRTFGTQIVKRTGNEFDDGLSRQCGNLGVSVQPSQADGIDTQGNNPDAAGGIFNVLLKEIVSDDAAREFEATQQFRKLLSIERSPPIQEVIDAGIIPRLIYFLSDYSRPDLQFEAAWALTNIASGTSEQTKVVVNGGAVPIFVSLLSSEKEDVCEQAVWALGNISGDCSQYRNLVLQSGALEPLLAQLNLEGQSLSMLRNGSWTLSNLCRGKPPPPFEIILPSLRTLCSLIQLDDSEVLTDACWALSYVSDGSNEKIQHVINSGVCPRLVELLLCPNLAVQTPALRTVGNIATGNNEQTDEIIRCGAIPKLKELLNTSRKNIKKEACWTISNITAGNPDQIEAVIESGAFYTLLVILFTADFEIKKEAAWAIANAASGGLAKQIAMLVNLGCAQALCSLLDLQDKKIVEIALEALQNILRIGKNKKEAENLISNPYATLIEEAGGIRSIELLYDSPDQELCQKAWHIIFEYFPREDDQGGSDLADDTGEAFSSFHAPTPDGGFNFSSTSNHY